MFLLFSHQGGEAEYNVDLPSQFYLSLFEPLQLSLRFLDSLVKSDLSWQLVDNRYSVKYQLSSI